jgi:hypothetical protein
LRFGFAGAHRVGLVQLEGLEAGVHLRRSSHGRPNPRRWRAQQPQPRIRRRQQITALPALAGTLYPRPAA